VTSSPKSPQLNGLVQTHDWQCWRMVIPPRDDQLGSPALRLMSRNIRTSLDSEILMPATISDVPRNWKLSRSNRLSTQTQPSRVFAKGDNVLVEERKGEWFSRNVKEFADIPRSLLVQDYTTNRVYRQNTKHVKKTNMTIKRKVQKTMYWKSGENGETLIKRQHNRRKLRRNKERNLIKRRTYQCLQELQEL
jgi:hypothetical protein